MSYSPHKELSPGTKPDNKCYRCGERICFISKNAETPSGKQTRNPSTGKVIPLDPSTFEYHVCNLEDIDAYKETEERKKRTEQWLSTQKSGQEVAGSSTSYMSLNRDTSSNHYATDNNNSMNPILEKILASIDDTNAVLEQMQTDFKAGLMAIKNTVKIVTDRSSADNKV